LSTSNSTERTDMNGNRGEEDVHSGKEKKGGVERTSMPKVGVIEKPLTAIGRIGFLRCPGSE